MLKGDDIGGYQILNDFIIAGGMSKIAFAKKGGTEYFIKEFLTPRFPIEGSPGSPATKQKRKDKCAEFENHHKLLNQAIAKKVSFGGNLVYAVDFFRFNTSYYKVTEKVVIASLSPSDISKLSLEKTLIIMKTVTHSLKILHELKIVHGDLKPDNILIKKTSTGGYTTKLIDFDNSYFSGKPPLNPEEVVGTPEYYSPELANYIKSVDTIGNRKSLTVQSDIFALGVIFCEYLTGNKPIFSKRCNYAWEDVADGNSLTFKDGLRTKKLDALIKSMLVLSHDMRPSISEVFEILRSPDILKDEIVKEAISETTTTGLRMSKNLKRAISNSDEITPIETSEKLRGKGLKSSK